VLRTIRLFRLFLKEQSEPDTFYREVAEDSIRQVTRYAELAGKTVIDLGGGPGHFTRAFQARGSRCLLVEPDPAELMSRGEPSRGAIRGDGLRLPVTDGAADICFSSNVLEHVADPIALLDEMIRATRGDGLIYLAFTNWYSPWGGHEMSPWHYLGARYAERRYVRRHGRQPKNLFGTGLYAVHIGQMLRHVRSRDDVAVIEAMPRYYPRWCRAILLIPGLREIGTWNLLLVLRRSPIPAASEPSRPVGASRTTRGTRG
jgi:SAM-dependent methyltransferase